MNDRYEFYEELDLDIEDGRLLSPKADRSVRNLYKLFAVLVRVLWSLEFVDLYNTLFKGARKTALLVKLLL